MSRAYPESERPERFAAYRPASPPASPSPSIPRPALALPAMREGDSLIYGVGGLKRDETEGGAK